MAAPRVLEEIIPYVVHHLRRVNEILKLAIDQFRVMETLTPQDFLAFRSKLGTASGLQSFQMREIEAILGPPHQQSAPTHTDPVKYMRAVATSPVIAQAIERIRQVQQEKSLRDALQEWLYRTPIQGSRPGDPEDQHVVKTFLTEYLAALAHHNEGQITHLITGGGDEQAVRAQFSSNYRLAKEFLFAEDIAEAERPHTSRIRAGILFIESYRELPLLAWPRLLIDTVVEMEELFVLWRTRHARMVERIIGRRVGTGGSAGVEYLDQTTRYRVFPELWAIRTLLLPRTVLPPLQKPEVYGFAVEL
jgi:tryptophan 2,3-dioxygenase